MRLALKLVSDSRPDSQVPVILIILSQLTTSKNYNY